MAALATSITTHSLTRDTGFDSITVDDNDWRTNALLSHRERAPYFTETRIRQTLQQADSSLERVARKLHEELFGFQWRNLVALDDISSAGDAKTFVRSNGLACSDYFPLVFNRLEHHLSLREYVDLILERSGVHYRTGKLLKWLPLFEDALSNGVEGLIEAMLCRETHSSGSQHIRTIFEIAQCAPVWCEKVSHSFRDRIFELAYEFDQDAPLHHLVLPGKLDQEIRKSRYSHYLSSFRGTAFEELPATDMIVPAISQNNYAGICPDCTRYHWHGILDDTDDNYGRIAIIRSASEPLFVLKLRGEPSMVAINSMKTPDGRIATMRGGLYVPPRELQLQAGFADHPRDFFRCVDITGPLKVLPIGWIDRTDVPWNALKFQTYLDRVDELAASNRSN